ncbi:glycoside hydrolase superfamily [Aspergillus pseudoustus]|uniref:Glycoside hydrolase superfamily n=1 Tax=Aspergillus pseudoustus TaxID=1810923 RepID=A0ABR4JC09_9EURO
MVKVSLVVAALAAASPVVVQGHQGPAYKDPSLPIERRVKDLLSRMTVEEKTAQLIQGDVTNWMDPDTGAFNETGLIHNMNLRAGAFYVGYPSPASWIAENIKIGQDYLIKNTRLGIPAIVQSEGIHGFLLVNATIFNSPIGYACAWDPDLVQEMAKVVAEEAAAIGVNQVFAPVSDLARELRYGRVEEGFSEDPYLSGELSYAVVIGMQRVNVAAMVKHFLGYSVPEQGLNTGPVHAGERELRTTWMPAFKRAIVDAGAWGVMGAYHSYDGMPAVADKEMLTDILRGEWNYPYFLVSDAGATDRLCTAFKVCQAHPIDSDAITLAALPAGTDMEMGGGSFNYYQIPRLVKDGRLHMKTVDKAVSRVLRTKFRMGLFENPYSPSIANNEWSALIHTPDAVQLARRLDRESIVLLENHDSTLPLKKSGNIAVIGPMAYGFMNYGDYVVKGSQYRGVTPLDGIKAAVGDSASIHYAKGCESWSNDQSGFQEAIEAAQKSDVAIVVVGTWSRDQDELWRGYNATTGETVDVNSLSLVGAQSELVRAVADTGVPTVVVFSSGKPVTETWMANSTAALVQQFYPSEQGGHALADVLFGDYNPSGRLSVSFPRDVGSLPVYYDHLNSARSVWDSGHVTTNGTIVFGHQYAIGNPQPWYPFGYGKSYTTFEYSAVSLDKANATVADTVTAKIRITNTGSVDGTEVVQLYVVDTLASVDVPNRKLKGFKKVPIGAGQTETVQIKVAVQELGLWNQEMKYTVEPGEFTFLIGRSSADIVGNATLYVS